MQTQAAPQTTAPAKPTVVIPAAPGSEAVTIASPLTKRDVAILRARREELSTQLNSVDSRRSKMLSQLANTGDETARKGLENRIALLDQRQLQLETDLAETGRQLSSAPAGLVAATEDRSFGGFDSDLVGVLGGAFTILVLAPLAFSAARMMWKKSSRPPLPPSAFTETAQRLERIEQSVDAIAVEIERVSEGQRFVTKLLSEGGSQRVGAGERKPQAIPAGQ
ncbi:MAG: hypothetical protein ABR585_03085 [Gemmatimonadaceae bacterium]